MTSEDDEKDTPIDPQSYRFGVNVIDIGDIRVARGKSRRPHSACKHRRMHYDPWERRIWCPDCERDLEPFDAFVALAENSATFSDLMRRREQAVAEAERFSLRSRAAKALDEVWRSRNMVPICPTCHHGLLPEMFSKGCGTQVSREYALARLKTKAPE